VLGLGFNFRQCCCSMATWSFYFTFFNINKSKFFLGPTCPCFNVQPFGLSLLHCSIVLLLLYFFSFFFCYALVLMFPHATLSTFLLAYPLTSLLPCFITLHLATFCVQISIPTSGWMQDLKSQYWQKLHSL